MIGWFIELRDEKAQKGWFMRVGAEGKPLITQDPSGAAVYQTEDDAEVGIQRLVETCGLDLEEAMVKPLAIDDVYRMELKGEHDEDGISVVREGDQRFITVHNLGVEASEELPSEVADLLVRVLEKIDRRLGAR